MSARSVKDVVVVEWTKLAAQWKTWVVLLACALGPVAFVLAIGDSQLPDDTLFGRSLRASGLAAPLVVLGFAALWAFPAVASVVGGDAFSSEDRLGTLPVLLVRGASRDALFVGKVVIAFAFTFGAVSLLATSFILAAIVALGRDALIGLSGTELSASRALPLIIWAWASVVPPALGFTALAVLASVATRSSVAGTSLPVIAGLVMAFASTLNGPSRARDVFLTTPLEAWHGLFAEPAYYGPLVHGAVTSAAYLSVCLGGAYVLWKRREA